MPSWISADRAEAAGKTLAIEGLAEGVEELRAGVEDRHRGRRAQHADRTFLAESEAQLRERAVAARPAGAIQNDPRTTGAVCGEPS